MRALLCLILLTSLTAADLDAQRRRDRHRRSWTDRAGPVEFGVRAGYDFDESAGFAGTQVRVPLIPQLSLVPSADVFFDDSRTEWQLNADLLAKPRALGGLYGGTGVAFASRDRLFRTDDEVDVGYNLFLGIDADRVLDTRLRPFAEARWSRAGDDFDPFRLMLGFNVPI